MARATCRSFLWIWWEAGKLRLAASVVAGQPRSSKIQISHFSVDNDVGSATESFEKALVAGDISSICQTHISQAKTEEEKADWQVIETLIAENPRKRVTEYLGFTDEVDEATNGVTGLDLDESKAEETTRGGKRNSGQE
jgi:protein transport protein SEC31